MCAVAGIIDYQNDFLHNPKNVEKKLERMNTVQKHRGPDADGIYVTRHCGLGHVRLKVIDLNTGDQPMYRKGEKDVVISYNGEIYNMKDLKLNMQQKGVHFETQSDTEVLLAGYEMEGIDFLKKLNGVYAFALWDEAKEILYMVRDPFGVKPLFYRYESGRLYVASECKAILAVSELPVTITEKGLCEVLALGPAKTYGEGIFEDMKEVKPGFVTTVTKNGIKENPFFELIPERHTENYEETVDHVKYLVQDAVKLQTLSDVPICTFLSGGLDSSLVSSIIQKNMDGNGGKLHTYSFEFVDNNVNFQENAFQPTLDHEYVEIMTRYLGTDHSVLWCDARTLYDYLEMVVDARDFPGMADVESSLLYFCKQVSAREKVALTGECADEVFGGYPWFYKEELRNQDFFPWTTDWNARIAILRNEVIAKLPLKEYAYDAYQKTVQEAPVLADEEKEAQRNRQIQYLNIKWFMQTLLDRMDRTSMYFGLEARVPFADKRLVSYLYNVPWEMKAKNGIIKGLLRDAGKDFLPDIIYQRKKSPYPKTYDPVYEALVKRKMMEIIADTDSPIHRLIDVKKVMQFCENPANYKRPFYGQLMAGPQFLAYFIQLEYWLRKYKIEIKSKNF